MALSDADIRRAEETMQAEIAAGPRVVEAHYERRRGRVVVRLDNGMELAFPSGLAEGIEKGSAAELSEIEISPAGFGLHWPRLDADLYLPGLLQGIFGSPSWMAGLMGRLGGRARTAAKAECGQNERTAWRPSSESSWRADLIRRLPAASRRP